MFNPLGNLIVSGYAPSLFFALFRRSSSRSHLRSKDSNVRFWDSVSGLCIRTLNAQLGEVTSVDMSDSYLLTNSRDNSARLWDVRMVGSDASGRLEEAHADKHSLLLTAPTSTPVQSTLQHVAELQSRFVCALLAPRLGLGGRRAVHVGPRVE
jgi:WD40 repeat protein